MKKEGAQWVCKIEDGAIFDGPNQYVEGFTTAGIDEV
jgi:hypothetical protein